MAWASSVAFHHLSGSVSDMEAGIRWEALGRNRFEDSGEEGEVEDEGVGVSVALWDGVWKACVAEEEARANVGATVRSTERARRDMASGRG